MAIGFDAYHQWLGIPPAEQPPNLYRLLGLAPFESDPGVICTAAHERAIHLRSLQQGQRCDLSQKLQNEVLAARGCLLKADSKAAYDAKLRAHVAAKSAPESPWHAAEATSNSQPGVPVQQPQLQSDPQANSAGSDLIAFISAATQPVAARSDSAKNGATPAHANAGRAGAQAQWLIILTLAPILGIAVVTAAVMMASRDGGYALASRGFAGSDDGVGINGRRVHPAPPPPVIPPSPEPPPAPDPVPPPSDVPSVETWSARATALIQSGKSVSTPADRSDVLRKAMMLLNSAEGADRWSDEAAKLAELAGAVGQQTIEGALVADRLRTTESRIRRAKEIADGVPAAQETLAKSPDDPEANGIVGGFTCFQMDNWADGLPHLAKGSDDVLTKIAEAEQSSPTTPLDQFKLANLWWNAAKKLSDVASDPWYEPMRVRAAYWYRKYASVVTKGPAAFSAQQRIAEEEAAQAESAALADGKFTLPAGQPTDILPFVSTHSAMVVAGRWSRDDQEISVEPGASSRIVIPVIVKGSYDVEIEFTRTSNQTLLWALIPVGSRSCAVFLSHMSGGDSGLDAVNGLSPADARNPIAVRPGALENGHRYRLFVSVRINADDDASIDASLDGKPYLPQWTGDPATLSHDDDGHPSELGLGANYCGVTFHSAKLDMLSGSATLDSDLISASGLATGMAATTGGGTANSAAGQGGATIIAARWGMGNRWADVTAIVRNAVARGQAVYANPNFLRSDPAYLVRKQLQITYQSANQRNTASIAEGNAWSPPISGN